MEDPAKKRLKYLVKSGTVVTADAILATVTAVGFVVTPTATIAFIGLFLWLLLNNGHGLAQIPLELCWSLLTALWVLTFVSWFTVEKIADTPLVYVPPVKEQIAQAPAEAILVRGCCRPAAAAEELLRPASASETPAAELLRNAVL